MRSLRKRLRRVVLASLPAAALGCYSPLPDSLGSSTAGATSSSATGTTGSGTTSSSGSSGSGSTTGSCLCGCGQEVPTAVVAPFDGGWADGGDMTNDTCHAICVITGDTCSALPADGGNWEISCPELCTGRRPEGLCEPALDARGALGAHFARMAHLEAASVPAFRRLARELERFGAPKKLVRAAERAARDEVRHAKSMGQFAARFDAAVPRVQHRRFQPRSLEAFALENAVEGCVRETFGAAVALAQAQQARDAGLRAAMAAIADDELRHAELAWSIDRWLDGVLDRDARARIERAKRDESAKLGLAGASPSDAPLAAWLGLPDAAQAARISAGLRCELGLA